MEHDPRNEIRVALAAGPPGLDHGLEARLEPSREALVEPLAELAELIARWGRRINLTGHDTPGAVARHLIADAIALDALLPDYGSAVDLGAGAGLPAFPLALLHPDRRYTLVESRERPHHFHRQVVRVLGVENVETLRGRAEVLPVRASDLVVAQAMGPPAEVLPLMVAWLAVGGCAAIPYSAEPPEIAVPAELGVEPLPARQYRVATTGVTRSLWLARRP